MCVTCEEHDADDGNAADGGSVGDGYPFIRRGSKMPGVQ